MMESLKPWDPSQVGPFRVLRQLGAGAMGRVYLGRSAAGRLVAIKTVRGEFAADADYRLRFAHEVAAASRVGGMFTAAVVAADPEAETPWLATAYIPAPNLRGLVRGSGPLPVPAVRWLAAGCAEALESIHAAGLVHRDLKPSNVLVSLDGPKVIDFGVARAAERAALTLSLQPIGTPAFMAPEQAGDSRLITAAADVFSLGSTLVYAATAHAPYRGKTMTDVLAKLAISQPDLSGLPDQLYGLVAACLVRDPRARPTPGEVLDELAPFINAEAGERLARTVLPEAAARFIMDLDQREEPADDAGSFGPEAAGTKGHARRNGGLAVAGTAGGIAGLLMLGGLVGVWVAGDETPTTAAGRRPAPGPPPPPLSGEHDRPTGEAAVQVNQPFGDGHTLFVLHGTGWSPGHQITVRVDGRSTSPAKPTADRKGTFNYAVNQTAEFWKGPIPPGVHTAIVSAGGSEARVSFEVTP